MNTHSVLGKKGEQFATRYLLASGYELIEHNWRSPIGEIDLVMSHADEIVFVEVKTRSSMLFGDPLNAVDARKLFRLRRLARLWLSEQEMRAPWRIDVIGLVSRSAGDFDIQHLVGL